jgi:TPR repeat protein
MMRKRSFGTAVCIWILAWAAISPVAAEEAAEPADPLQAGLAAIDEGDLIGAVESLQLAADEGSAEAQAWLGYIYDYAEEDELAVQFYRAAAEKGNVRGIAGLGEMYAKGEGIEQDLDEGRRYFTRAAEMGHKESMRALIAAYEKGGLGVEPDAGQADYWKSRLADAETDKQ